MHKKGWIPDLPDKRDFLYTPHILFWEGPPMVDLRPNCPPVYDQGNLGSCTANAIAAAFQFDEIKQGLPDSQIFPSRLFLYYNERVMERTAEYDSGAQIRDGIKSVAKQGICEETIWPYIIDKFAIKPPKKIYQAAKLDRAITYMRIIHRLIRMKTCLIEGYPFTIGVTLYESFESPEVAKTGFVPMPASSEGVIGGHAMLVVGYDEMRGVFIVRNSWGPDWGDHGYCYIPYDYLLDSNLADDFWTVRKVT